MNLFVLTGHPFSNVRARLWRSPSVSQRRHEPLRFNGVSLLSLASLGHLTGLPLQRSRARTSAERFSLGDLGDLGGCRFNRASAPSICGKTRRVSR